MKKIKLKQRSKEWLQWRGERICASDAPIIMNVSPYKKIDKLLDEKIKCYDSVPNPYMQRGIDLEPTALSQFEYDSGIWMFPCVGEHENGWMAASFDGMTLEEDAIVEIKCAGKKDHQSALDGIIPKKYIPQLQHQMYVSGLNLVLYYSFDGEKGKIIELKRDDDYIEKMIEKEFEFLNNLLAIKRNKTHLG